MKKFMKLFLVALIVLTVTACSSEDKSSKGLKIGMVTDAGTLDDKSFNQGTWEGIVKYNEDNPESDIQYIQPTGESTQDYLEAISNLSLAGTEIIVLPGFKFEEAAGIAQAEYPDIKFVLIDSEPAGGNNENTVSIFFSEQESSFLAGVASALETQSNKVAFLGGMEVPAVQKLGWGYVAGIAYANQHLGTNTEIIDYIYQGTFTDLDAGKALSAGMYDKGADIIFAAAGAVGVGAITESKTRAESGDEVYIVGVDVDQYEEGILTDGSSTILTSAMKYLGEAAYTQIDKFANGEFEGGQTILMDTTLNGVGLPTKNPNLSESTLETINNIVDEIKNGVIKVPSTKEELQSFLDSMNCNFNLTY